MIAMNTVLIFGIDLWLGLIACFMSKATPSTEVALTLPIPPSNIMLFEIKEVRSWVLIIESKSSMVQMGSIYHTSSRSC